AKGETIELDNDALAGSVYVYEYKDGLLGAEPVVDAGDMEELVAGLNTASDIMVFFEYMTEVGKSNQIVFSGNAFPSTYRVVGETFVRDENGVDHVMQFEIPKAKLQSTFSLTMDVENVGTFDFNLEVLMDAK